MDTQELNKRRKKVQLAIGAVSMKKYLSIMALWFKGKLCKDEFDERARALFSDDNVRVHNEFLLSMLKRCSAVTNALGTRDLNRVASVNMQTPPKPQRQKSTKSAGQSVKKKPYTKPNFTQRFQPANQLRQVQPVKSPPPQTERLPFASSEHGLVPDAGMVEGRLFVAAWEAGLETVQNDTYNLIAHATEHMLKDIISHVLSSRSGYRVSRCNHFKQFVGMDAPLWALESQSNVNHNPDHPLYSENSLLRAQKEEADSVSSLARTGPIPPSNQPITALDMFSALQSDPSVMPSHVMYTLAMERLSTRLYHPSQEQMLVKHIEAHQNSQLSQSQAVTLRRPTTS